MANPGDTTLTSDTGPVPRTISVAIVDDEPMIARGLHRLCRASGLDAVSYTSGREFIAQLETNAFRPDCVLLDAQMPDMTGLEIQHYLTRMRLPTIIITADDTPELRARYLAAGAARYLQKPVAAEELLAAIAHAVAPLQGTGS